MTSTAPSAFENAIQVTPLTSHTYSANLSKDWCIGLVPHGGYTAALLHRAATTHLTRNAPSPPNSRILPICMQLSYLRRTRVGPAIITIQDTKLGARTSSIHITLSQTKEPKPGQQQQQQQPTSESLPLEDKVVGYITLSPEAAEGGPTSKSNWALHPSSTPGSNADGTVDLAALARTGKDGAWARYHPWVTLAAHENIELFEPVSTDRSLDGMRTRTIEQWARFRPGGEAGRWTNEALMYLVDAFPSGLDRLGAMAKLNQGGDGAGKMRGADFWYPTVTLTFDQRRPIPVEGVEWLYSRVVTRTVRGGRADLEVEVLDEEGEVIAVASQVGLVVDAARNVGAKGSFKRGKL